MNGKQADNKGAGGAWAWIRRNEVLLIGGLILAAMQYQAAHTAALVEQLSLRITSLETRMASFETTTAASLAAFAESQRQIVGQLSVRITDVQKNQNRIAGQLGQSITAVRESQNRAVEQLGVRITDVQKNQDRIAGQLGVRITDVQENQDRIAGQLGVRITDVQKNQDRVAERLGGRMAGLETRMTGLENSVAAIRRGQDRVAGRLGAPVTELEPEAAAGVAGADRTRADAPPGAGITERDEDVTALADGVNRRPGRIENEQGPPPGAPGAADAAPG